MLVGRETAWPRAHSLIQAHVAANDRGLADDDAGAVVDEEAFADLGARMNVDPCRRMRDLGDHPRQQRRAELVKNMRQPLVNDRRDARIADQHFVDAVRRRIAVECGADIGVEQGAHARQLLGESGDDAGRAVVFRLD